jgi:hypothetical protein
MGRIKTHLKNHFFKMDNLDGKLSDIKRKDILIKNLYSREKNTTRKVNAELQNQLIVESAATAKRKADEKLLHTPIQRRKKNNEAKLTPPVIRRAQMCLAPLPGPPEKRCKVMRHLARPNFSTSTKRLSSDQSHSFVSSTQKRLHIDDGIQHGPSFSPLLSNNSLETAANHPPLNSIGCPPTSEEK